MECDAQATLSISDGNFYENFTACSPILIHIGLDKPGPASESAEDLAAEIWGKHSSNAARQMLLNRTFFNVQHSVAIEVLTIRCQLIELISNNTRQFDRRSTSYLLLKVLASQRNKFIRWLSFGIF